MIPRRRALSALGTLALALAACRDRADEVRPPVPIRVVLKHHPLGDPGPFQRLLASFGRAHPDLQVSAELLPNAPGAVHQYLLTSLEGQSRDFDVFLVDVIWVAELARAGWLADLSDAFPPERVRKEFLPGPASAVVLGGRTYAVPWYADVGVFYHRTDLVPRAPRTYGELIEFAQRAMKAKKSIYGYVWQGLQSESLVCNAFEAAWGMGAIPQRPDSLVLASREGELALDFLRGLLTSGVSPPSVTSMGEEESRRVFQAGGAVFMRNWPYAYAEAESPSSAVRGRVAVSPLPTADGSLGHGALGGFQLAVSAWSPAYKREAVRALVAHLASHEAGLTLARDYGRLPARRAVYGDPRLAAAAPMIAQLLPAVERALPRPVTPYYPMFADALAAEISAAITGVRAPAEALRRAEALVNHLMREVT